MDEGCHGQQGGRPRRAWLHAGGPQVHTWSPSPSPCLPQGRSQAGPCRGRASGALPRHQGAETARGQVCSVCLQAGWAPERGEAGVHGEMAMGKVEANLGVVRIHNIKTFQPSCQTYSSFKHNFFFKTFQLGARVEPNINTGAGLKNGNLDVKVPDPSDLFIS